MLPSNDTASVVVIDVVSLASPSITSNVFTVTLLNGLPNISSPKTRFDALISNVSFTPSPFVSMRFR